MLSSISSGAILSKTRAMFGQRLTADDYKALASKKDVGSAAAYLRTLPAYTEALSGVSDNTVRRRQLEALLRQKHFHSFESLCRYELTIGERFSDFILLQTEIAQIIESISRIMANRRDGAPISVSPYLERRIKVDARALEAASSYEDLLAAVKQSYFYDTLASLGKTLSGDLVRYENALYAAFYDRIFDDIRHSLGGSAESTLTDLFTSQIDLENLVRMVRLKEYFKADASYIRMALLPHGNVRGNTAERLIACKDAPAVLECAENMKIFRGKLADFAACTRIDELPQRYMLRRSYHEIYFSSEPSVVMIAYLHISETEISNIIRIIEGIRYSVSPDNIYGMLLLPPREAGADEHSTNERKV